MRNVHCSATLLGGIALTALLTLPMGCVASDDGTADDPSSVSRDPHTGEDQFSIEVPNGISITLSVRQWQTDLNALPICAFVTVDGQFGPATTSATECFQSANGLQANGDVGRITLGAMCASLTEQGQVGLRNNTNCTQ